MLFLPSAAWGQFHGAAILKNPVGPDGTGRAHIGDTITAQIRIINQDDFNDTLLITNIIDVVHHTSGDVTTPNLLSSNVLLAFFGASITVTTTYPVLAADGPVLEDDAKTIGIDNHDGDNGTFFKQVFSNSFPGQIRILVPGITVTKTCFLIGNPTNPVVAYSGIVSNSGRFNTTLTNVVVIDDNGTPGNTSDDVTYLIGTLTNGQTASYSGTYLAKQSPTTNTVIARGTDALGLTVASTTNCVAQIFCNPQITVTKACPVTPVGPGGTVVFTGTVTNTGDVTLTNVFVVNNRPANNTPVVGPLTLVPGAGLAFTGSYTAPLDACSVSDTLTARGSFGAICQGGGGSITNTATRDCPLTPTPLLTLTKNCPANPVPVGGVLTFTGFISNSGNITLTNVIVVNNQPAPNTPLLGPITLAPGAARAFTNSYTVPAGQCGPFIDTLSATARSICGNDVSTNTTAACPGSTMPVIRVVKICPANPVAPGDLLFFTGSVSNAGNITLTNVIVVDDQPAPNTQVLGPVTLVPGQALPFTNSYRIPLDFCGPANDTLTATGTSLCGSNVSHTAPASCPVVTTPVVRVTKSCPPNPVAPGDLLVFTGSISNAGNISLTNVLVVDNQPAPNTPVFGPTNLAPGQVLLFTNSYRVPLDFCGPANDTLMATATSICGSNIMHTASASCPVVTTPIVRVTKNCPANPVAPGDLLVFTGSVSNAGNITLTNVLVVDNQPAPNTPVFGPTNLAPGQAFLFTNSYRIPLDFCGPAVDTLTATAASKCGSNVTHSISASCPVAIAPSVRVTKNCPATPVAPGDLLVFTGSVSNSGNITLTNVLVVDNQPAPNTPVFGPTNLAPGQAFLFTNSYRVPLDFCGPAVDTLTATATSICGNGVTNTATASCPIVTTPAVRVTKICPPMPASPGGIFIFTGTVTNTGNITLNNVLVVDDQPAPNTPVFGPVTLAPGAGLSFTGGYILPDTITTCTLTNNLTARAVSTCGVGVTNTFTAVCPVGLGAIGDFVWEDLNFNGCQDPNEPGIPNVAVQLLNCNSNFIASTVTGPQGQYLFTGLCPGSYIVRFMRPSADYFFTKQMACGNINTDSDPNPLNGLTACVPLNAGETNRTIDAGLYRLACLGDFIWDDFNRNGIQDTNEPGISNAIVYLLNCGDTNVLQSTVVGANGLYQFCNLTPGSYRIEVTIPDGYRMTLPNQGTNECVDSDGIVTTNGPGGARVILSDCVTLASGETNNCLDVGMHRPGAIGDFVWEDLNFNGIQDAGEPGINGVSVQLQDCNGNVLTNTVTAANGPASGFYLFTNLPPGNFVVRFVKPAGYSFTTRDAFANALDALDSDADTTNGLTKCYTLASGETNLTVDAGLFRTACLGDFIWDDFNRNGIQDTNEPGISNVMVFLLSCGDTNVLQTAVTGTNGLYQFCNLTPGSYRIEVTIPDGYRMTLPNQGANECVDSDGIVTTNGPGGRVILSDCVTLASGETNNCVDVGMHRPGAIGDFVWEDINFNGIQDAGEPGINGVPVQLQDCSGNVLTNTVTAANGPASGFYLFTNLPPGNYRVLFGKPAGYSFTIRDALGNTVDALDSDADTTNGLTKCYTLASGETNLTVDAGLFRGACLGDFIFDDFNRNGVQDTNEPGITNVTVYLLSCGSSNVISTFVTGTNGLYQFCDLTPGSYQINVVIPDGYRRTIENATNDCLDSDGLVTTNAPNPTNSSVTIRVITSECVTLTSGETNNCLDIGMHRPGAIGDFVWEDLNFNGIQDVGEPGINGVPVQLRDCSGNVLTNTVTAANGPSNGFYLFTNLPPGNYRVLFGKPAGYSFTVRDAAGNTQDVRDSDPDTATGLTACYALGSGETNLTVDAGLIRNACLGDFIFDDFNRNGIQDTNEPGITNVTVYLLSCGSSNVIASTVTGTNGLYQFCDLTPGSYMINVVVPTGYRRTIENATNDCLDSDGLVTTNAPSPTNSSVILTVISSECVTLISGETNNCLDIGMHRPGVIGDFVWEDRNFNGIQDAGEPGINGVSVQLQDCNGNVLTNTVTAANGPTNGFYLFTNLPPGNYVVHFVKPAGYSFTIRDALGNTMDALDSDADTTNGLTKCYALGSGETNLTVDAGLFRGACLGDYVFEDLDRNGIQNEGPSNGIPNVTLQLLGCAGTNVLRTTITDTNGYYLFCDLMPGSYRVQVVVPAGYKITIPNQGTDDCLDSDADPVTRITDCVTLVSGETNLCTDIGLYRPAAIGDFVFHDLNTNGVQEANEPGINGVTVQLFACTNDTFVLLASTTTASLNGTNGYYRFSNLEPGDYRVRFIKPPGFDSTPQDVGGNDALDSDADTNGFTVCYTLLAGQTNLTVDAGFFNLTPHISLLKSILPSTTCNPLVNCTPPYPFVSTNPLTSVVFNESEVLRAFQVGVTNGCRPTEIRAFYNDEHALLLGIRRVVVKTAGGSTTNDAPVSPLDSVPDSVFDPQVGFTNQVGDLAAVDPAGRPIFPSLFITDVTTNANDLSGDWQFGGKAIPPHAVFGTWKTGVRIVDKTTSPPTSTIDVDVDPAKNNWNVDGGDPVPGGLVNQGYGAEIRWDVSRLGLISNHVYRLYFMVHDGDQNKQGGDVGQGCATLGNGTMTTSTSMQPGSPVTYYYVVTNDGNVTVTNIVVTDDNGTPDFTGDDEIVGVVGDLEPGEWQSFERVFITPVALCTSNANGTVQTGLLMTKTLMNGDIEATFVQGLNVNDNTYGTNAIGWPSGHKFADLTGSDQATFEFRDSGSNVVLSFKLDYISASSSYPSGYGSLGVTGGDGGILVGSASNVVSFSTSLGENLNKQPFLGQLSKYTVNSPALNDPNSSQWEYRMIYRVVVKGTAFGSSGFGHVFLTAQHNSPSKIGSFTPRECSECVTNIAIASARFGTNTIYATASASTCEGPCQPLSTCVPPYPYVSSNPRTSLDFSESEVLRAFTVGVADGCMPTQIRVFYNDEHALLLGMRRIIVKTASGFTTNDYPVSPLTANPGSVFDPQVGSTAQTGDQAGTDVSDRPIFPALFITDITGNPTNMSGDWQFGGTAIPPHAVFGSWKAAVRTVDKTTVPPTVTVDPDIDPAKNNWNLDGGDTVPPGLVNQGYGAEVRWDTARLDLLPGHSYRLYFMVHDGDQNKMGGDAGQGCASLNIPPMSNCVPNFSTGMVTIASSCDSTVPVGSTVKFSATVANTGNVTLTNLTVTSSRAGIVRTIAVLPTGSSVTITGSYPTTAQSCPRVTNVLIVTGRSLCDMAVAATNSCATDVDCNVPNLSLHKTVDKLSVTAGGSVTYSYGVTNTGAQLLTNIVVTDDNGTPGLTSDDFIAGTFASLGVGQGVLFQQTRTVPQKECMTINGVPTDVGSLTTRVLANGDIEVQYIQSRNVVDNTYGTNAVGYPSGHTFNNLLGSDKAQFVFSNGLGQKVLDVYVDYISASAAFPSGYGSLGVTGGDGGVNAGSASNVVSATTSISRNLNQSPAFYGFTVNSPAPEANFPTWDYVDSYTIVVRSNTFGASGFGGVSVPLVHNSPSKLGFNAVIPGPCNACVTNLATVTAKAGNITLSASDTAFVCVDSSANNASPSMKVAASNGKLIISWPAMQGFVLQSAPGVMGPWTTESMTPTEVNGQMTVTVTAPTVGQKYFRLHQE